ncbi:hypothetical protein P691DRAFT_805449 [Macrolepiota fuliginosa MF-IS2]|uniref:Uncharacterized protein n=1 Tax=Macrolepiota fuliginosa MF-IS2 TaxID=1400762 RepID=A0A9P5X7R4_9AGAR|nr:hypothetical protein P691DRAFT_805449 [Macrolepiota fuliginosa MF-IS2]
MPDAAITTRASFLTTTPYRRPMSSPSASSVRVASPYFSSFSPSPSGSRYPSSLWTVSPLPAGTPASLSGYTSTIRTISPQIANFRPSARDIVKAIAPHVLDERRTRRRSSSRSSSQSRKPYNYSHHHRNRLSDRDSQPYYPHNTWSEAGFACRSGRRKQLKSSPLRVAAVVCWDDNSSIYLRWELTTSFAERTSSASELNITIDSKPEEMKRPSTSPGLSRLTTLTQIQIQSPTHLVAHQPPPMPSHARDSSWSSTSSSESLGTNSSGSVSSGCDGRAGNESDGRKQRRRFRFEPPRLFR